MVRRVWENPCGTQRNGPYAIRWERSEQDETAALIDGFELNGVASVADTLAALEALPRSGPVREACTWVRHQARARGRTEFSRADIEAVIARQVAVRRQRYGSDNYDFAAMTVQQAKNREFEGVFVLWPYQIAATPSTNGDCFTAHSRAHNAGARLLHRMPTCCEPCRSDERRMRNSCSSGRSSVELDQRLPA